MIIVSDTIIMASFLLLDTNLHIIFVKSTLLTDKIFFPLDF